MRRLLANKEEYSGLWVHPRWPYSAVYISEATYQALMKAQDILGSQNMRLVLTRGFENQGQVLKIFHALFRALGAMLFCCLYPQRYREIRQIFCPNGHNERSRCVADVNLLYHGKPITLLPYGVFTPQSIIAKERQVHEDILGLVFQALDTSGFKVHPNQTESMQIHCELKQERSNEL